MSAVVELEDFLGAWRDSLGNHVLVEWARSNNRGGQLDVALTNPRGGRDPIRLNVKRHYDGRFSCGHYDLDLDETRPDHIVWVDYRKSKRKSIWERDGSPPPRGDGGGDWKESGDRNWNRSWDDRNNRHEDRRSGGRGQWDDRQKWRDSSDGDWRSGDSGWRGGRDSDWRKQDTPISGVNAIPVGRPPPGMPPGGPPGQPPPWQQAWPGPPPFSQQQQQPPLGVGGGPPPGSWGPRPGEEAPVESQSPPMPGSPLSGSRSRSRSRSPRLPG